MNFLTTGLITRNVFVIELCQQHIYVCNLFINILQMCIIETIMFFLS